MKLDIIAGFLGAGKTTLIKQLLKEVSKKEKIVIIENEIGEVNIDAKELQDLKASIKEITSGCICCSLSSNLKSIIETIEGEGSVDRIIIEPTGLAVLSDLLGIFDYIDKSLFDFNLIITILDVLELEMFAGNFGTFFSDQIRNSDIIILSKIEKASSSDVEFAKYYTNNLNPNAPVIDISWDKLNIEYLENLNQKITTTQKSHHEHQKPKQIFDGFENILVKPKKFYSKDELDSILKDIKSKSYGNVIRMKGFLSLDEKTSFKVDYVLDQIYITEKNSTSENMLVIIGKDLKANKLEKLFK
ncbi:MAG: GTP-binding protein [archaeon]|nr:GTP-binding protein [archaeon]